MERIAAGDHMLAHSVTVLGAEAVGDQLEPAAIMFAQQPGHQVHDRVLAEIGREISDTDAARCGGRGGCVVIRRCGPFAGDHFAGPGKGARRIIVNPDQREQCVGARSREGSIANAER